jgi:pyruvate/2-oxoglutarate dehydrogenase complex dihydrolipoamide acyltransferase (E2) component
MEIKMKMPDLSTNEGAEIGITRWLVEVGQPVRRGQPLVEVETDKAMQEVECIATGTLKAVHVQAGDQVAVGHIIATIETN